MKKMLLLSVAIILMLFSSTTFAQTVSNGDTLEVGPRNSQGGALGSLNEAIKADTTATGARAHSVYRLERGVQYILTEVIQADFPLEIIAKKPVDGVPESDNRPPIIRCGVKEDGSNLDQWWHLYEDATFKDLWISGVTFDGTGGINWISQTAHSEGKTMLWENCIIEFPYTGWGMFNDAGNKNTYKTLSCIFMNIGNPTNVTWNGAIMVGGKQDSVIHRNTTFYNFGCFATNGYSFYTEIDHCSFINSMLHPIESHSDVIKVYTNNLWVNCSAFSDDEDEVIRHFDQEVKGIMNYAEIQFDPQELDSLYGPGGVYEKDFDPNGDGTLTEDELIWKLRNNNWYYTQPIEDYWATFDQVVAFPWMNTYNAAMFTNQEEAWTWTVTNYDFDDSTGAKIDSTTTTMQHNPFQFFTEVNTTNIDPGIVDMNGTDELLAQNCINIRNENYELPVGDPVKWHGIDNYLAFTWPLDIDLSYTNQALTTAGDFSTPIGAMTWWDMDYVCDVEEGNEATPASFTLGQNYPNPFNPTTSIKYKVNTVGNVKMTIHNILGEEVKTLVNEVKAVGSYDVQWDGTNDMGHKVSTGVYFYRMEQGANVETRKMLMVK